MRIDVRQCLQDRKLSSHLAYTKHDESFIISIYGYLTHVYQILPSQPTQAFFNEDMGLPLTIEPNYETYECTFSFGKTPTLESESIAVTTPCLARCPTAGALRKLHNGEIGELPASDAATLPVCERLTS